MFSAILPWPARAERKAVVAEAQRRAVEAQREAGAARKLTEELHQMREKNHVQERLEMRLEMLIKRRAEGKP